MTVEWGRGGGYKYINIFVSPPYKYINIFVSPPEIFVWGGGYKYINIFVLGGYKYINIFVWGVTYIFLYSYPPNTNIEGLYVFKP